MFNKIFLRRQQFIIIIIILFQKFNAHSQGSINALTFDGADDYVDCGSSININGSSFTIEVWAKRASTSAANLHFFSLGSPANNQGLHVRWQSNNTLRFAFWNNDYDISGLTIDLNWHHYAFAYNASTNTKRVYLDGKLVGSDNSNPNDFLGSGKFKIGVLVDGIGNGNLEPWYGNMDEIRVWGVELTQTQIRDWMCKKVTSSHPNWSNLLAYYKCDEGVGTSLSDSKGSNAGTLTNGTTWITSDVPLGDQATWLASASAGSSVNIAHTNGDDLTATITSGTADLMVAYFSVSPPINNTPPPSFIQLSEVNYYGVKLFGNTSAVYTAVYNYEGHPGIINEANLGLARRSGNTSNWVDATAMLDQNANTLTLTGQTGAEYILGGSCLRPVPTVSVSASASTVCMGNTVTLTANVPSGGTITSSGGNRIHNLYLQWYIYSTFGL